MLTTGFIDKVTGLLSGPILLTGVLPALIASAYLAVIVVRLTDWPVGQIWGGQLSLPTLLAVLWLLALTLLIEGLNPVLKRWLAGDALWIPKALVRLRERERQQLEREMLEALEEARTWQTTADSLAALIAEGREAYPAGSTATTDAGTETARALRDEVQKASLNPAEATLVVQHAVARLFALYVSGKAPRRELDSVHMHIRALSATVSAARSGVLGQHQRDLATQFPVRHRIRATRFGNIMGAIDSYPFTRYGIDGQLLWPRMRQAAKPVDEWRAVEAAQSRVDFAVAAVWIHIGLVTVALLTIRLLLAWDPALLVGLVLGGVAGAAMFYQMALHAATAYGLNVHAAIDLNRWALIDALRLPRPANAADEYALWSRLQASVLFPPEPDDRRATWYR